MQVFCRKSTDNKFLSISSAQTIQEQQSLRGCVGRRCSQHSHKRRNLWLSKHHRKQRRETPVTVRIGTNVDDYGASRWCWVNWSAADPGRRSDQNAPKVSKPCENTCLHCWRAHAVSTFLSLRVPTFLGSIENVFELDQFYKYYGGDASEKREEDEAAQ